jgi:hypothetical protein
LEGFPRNHDFNACAWIARPRVHLRVFQEFYKIQWFIIRFEKLTAILRYSPLLDKAMCFSLAGLSECFQLQCIDQFLWTGWPMAISMGALSGAVRVGNLRGLVEKSNCFEGKCMQKL